MKRKWKILIGSLVGLLILAVLIFQNSQGLEADVLEVHPLTITSTFEENGKVIAGMERTISSEYGGKLAEIFVEEGQLVKKGELLAVLESKELQLQLEELRAQLKSIRGEEQKSVGEPQHSEIRNQLLEVQKAEQSLQLKEATYQRIKKLFEAGAATESEYQEAKTAYESAKSFLEQQQEVLALLNQAYSPQSGTRLYYAGRKEALEAQIKLLEYKIQKCNLTAPIDGIVANINVKKGEVVPPASPLMKVFDKNSYKIETFVLTEDAASIKNNMKVRLIQDNKNEDVVFEGTVEKIAPTAEMKISSLGLEEQRVKVTIIPDIPAELELYPGYSLDVEFTTSKAENKLVVPKTALFPYEDGEALWVVENGRAELRPVETGFENDLNVAIEKGLKKGDLVILNPQLEGIEEGKKIKIKIKE